MEAVTTLSLCCKSQMSQDRIDRSDLSLLIIVYQCSLCIFSGERLASRSSAQWGSRSQQAWVEGVLQGSGQGQSTLSMLETRTPSQEDLVMVFQDAWEVLIHFLLSYRKMQERSWAPAFSIQPQLLCWHCPPMSLTSRAWEHCLHSPAGSRWASRFRHYYPCFSGFHFLFLSARLLKYILQPLVALFSELPWTVARGCCQRS